MRGGEGQEDVYRMMRRSLQSRKERERIKRWRSSICVGRGTRKQDVCKSTVIQIIKKRGEKDVPDTG